MKWLFPKQLLFLAVNAAIVASASAAPFAIQEISRGRLSSFSRDGTHAVIVSDNDYLLWSHGHGTKHIAGPSDRLFDSFNTAVNDSGQVLYIEASDTECKITRLDTDGTFKVIADIAPNLEDNFSAAVCEGAINNLGESAMFIGSLNANETNPVSLYFSDGVSLTKVQDFMANEVGQDLKLNDSRLAAFDIFLGGMSHRTETIDLTSPNSPVTNQRVFEHGGIVQDLGNNGTVFLSADGEDVQSAPSTLSDSTVFQGLRDVSIFSSLLERDGSLYGQSLDKSIDDNGRAEAAFTRTPDGKFEDINCAMPNSIREHFTNAAARLSDGSVLTEAYNTDTLRKSVVVLQPTGEAITQRYCAKSVQTQLVGACGTIAKNQGTVFIPDGSKCTARVRVLDSAGLPLKNVSVLVNGAPTRIRKLTLRTDNNGRAHFTFVVDHDSIFSGEVSVTAPYRNTSIRSKTVVVLVYDDEV